MGQGVYERRTLKLEQEAKAHVESRRVRFYDELAEQVGELERYANSHLWHSEEKDKAIEHITAFVLWAKYCAKIHGIK